MPKKADSTLKQRFLLKLKESGLTASDAKKLGMEPITAQEAALLKFPEFCGFKIPYFDERGSKTSFLRFRFLEDTRNGFERLTKKKLLRYTQPKNTLNEVYMPPFTKWKEFLADTSLPLIITEGELKAACATKAGFPTLGLGGVWNWKASHKGKTHLDIFDRIALKDRTVYIVFDSDARSNSKVMAAEQALAKELLKLNAVPHIARIPSGSDEGKVGLDDFLVAGGDLFSILGEAYEFRISAELHRLNTEVVYVRDPGIILKIANGQRMSVHDFASHAYATRIFYEEIATKKSTKLIEKSAPKEWVKWPGRAEVERVVYCPGEEQFTESGVYNSWSGWGIEPKEGDVSPWHILLDHIFATEPGARVWFEKWLAYPLQYPGTKMYTAAVLWGRYHGTGKSVIGHTMFKIYGKNSTEISDRNLVETHNEWAEGKQFVLGDEIAGGDKRGVADRIKSIITQRDIRVNKKFIPSFTIDDCINYLFTSNQPDSFFIEEQDRRFFVHEVVRPPLSSDFYLHTYHAWLHGGQGPAALFYYLLSLDVSDFEPRGQAMVTRSKLDMIDSGRSDLGSWVSTLRDYPDTILRLDSYPIPFALWRSEDLLRVYDPQGGSRVTANGLARELRRAGFLQANGGKVCRTANGQMKIWIIRPHDKYETSKGTEIGRMYDEERDKEGSKKKGKY